MPESSILWYKTKTEKIKSRNKKAIFHLKKEFKNRSIKGERRSYQETKRLGKRDWKRIKKRLKLKNWRKMYCEKYLNKMWFTSSSGLTKGTPLPHKYPLIDEPRDDLDI